MTLHLYYTPFALLNKHILTNRSLEINTLILRLEKFKNINKKKYNFLLNFSSGIRSCNFLVYLVISFLLHDPVIVL